MAHLNLKTFNFLKEAQLTNCSKIEYVQRAKKMLIESLCEDFKNKRIMRKGSA